jgi:chemosensory pili system protein ChpA (sensor histidine kinase/response regulator)
MAPGVTEISGRGVGMDVIKSTVAELDGDVELRSVAGAGTRLTLKFPHSLRIS